MRTKTLVGLVFITSLAALAADKIRPLKVKVGLWEVTTTATTSGDLPIPAGLLEKLTAAQRARVKERMKAKVSEAPITTRRQCLTREQLDKEVTFGEDPKSCARTVVASTGNKLEMRIACVSQSQDIKSEGTFQVAAIDSERVKGSVHLTLTGDRTGVSTSEFTARWIGPTCGSTK
jgi:Protein of unknown function (DUF3617)